MQNKGSLYHLSVDSILFASCVLYTTATATDIVPVCVSVSGWVWVLELPGCNLMYLCTH